MGECTCGAPTEAWPGGDHLTIESLRCCRDWHRARLHDVETLCDPAGMVAENTLIRDQNAMLQQRLERLTRSAQYALQEVVNGETGDAEQTLRALLAKEKDNA